MHFLKLEKQEESVGSATSSSLQSEIVDFEIANKKKKFFCANRCFFLSVSSVGLILITLFLMILIFLKNDPCNSYIPLLGFIAGGFLAILGKEIEKKIKNEKKKKKKNKNFLKFNLIFFLFFFIFYFFFWFFFEITKDYF